MVDLAAVEFELRKRLNEPYYSWGRKQSDAWDDRTDFIYRTRTWKQFKQQTAGFPTELYRYAVNRWFNFWSAMGVETIFCSIPGVVAGIEKDKLVDFSIQGTTFDHKSTQFPASYPYDPYYAAEYPWHLAQWLYQNQSTERRHHLANKLFIVFLNWRDKAELRLIHRVVDQYIKGFNQSRLIQLKVNGSTVLTDILWIPGKPER